MKKEDNEIYRILQRHSVTPDVTVRDAMKMLNNLSGDSLTLFVRNDSGKILGSVTDGDIRRSLIGGRELTDRITDVMNADFLYVTPDDDIPVKMEMARARHIELLPLMERGEVTDLYDLRVMRTKIPVEAVMMAGGRGERLRPLTDTTPKPLLPVDGKPIIDYNVEDLEACGVEKVHVTVNYLADMIEDHFDHRNGRAKVSCVKEPKRLGTLGSLSLVEGIESDDIIIMNSDLLTNVDFEGLYVQHRKSGADFTIAAVPYSVSVPFAIMRLHKDRVTAIEEKPTYNYFANGGVYMMKSSLISRIKKGEYLDAPDFIMSLIKAGKYVGCYHLRGTWIDIGSPDDYRMACELMTRKNKL